jgi:FixJ family two-component response regulator
MADNIRIALIDDDSAVLDSLRLYLERRGMMVSCFLGAEDFLATNEAMRSFDCVVTDVRMPGLSGIDLVQEMAAQGKPCSGHPDHRSRGGRNGGCRHQAGSV